MSTATQRARSLFRWFLVVAAGLFFGIVVADSLGFFEPSSPYRVVHHPTHDHYIPRECGDDVPASNFPTQPPDPGERITCDGRIISTGE